MGERIRFEIAFEGTSEQVGDFAAALLKSPDTPNARSEDAGWLRWPPRCSICDLPLAPYVHVVVLEKGVRHMLGTANCEPPAGGSR